MFYKAVIPIASAGSADTATAADPAAQRTVGRYRTM
jgi:hypothetical protein